MARKLSPGPLVFASHNTGKLREIKALLDPHGIVIESAAELRLAEPEETENSFASNALLKAKAASPATGLPALADDSGLSVDALGGAPGVHSARWAGAERDFGRAMRRVEIELKLACATDHRARFVCVLAVAWPDGHSEIFEGDARGRLVFPPRGGGGFGYDPIFVPDGYAETFGEMDPAAKHKISHRAVAFRRLAIACL